MNCFLNNYILTQIYIWIVLVSQMKKKIFCYLRVHWGSRANSRLAGMYCINLLAKCEMNNVISQPQGSKREVKLSIIME